MRLPLLQQRAKLPAKDVGNSMTFMGPWVGESAVLSAHLHCKDPSKPRGQRMEYSFIWIDRPYVFILNKIDSVSFT